MKMKRIHGAFLVLVLMVTIPIVAAKEKKQPETPRYQPKFDYTPPPQAEKVSFQEIVLLAEGRSLEDTLALGTSLAKKARAGEDFVDLAKENSQVEPRLRGGVLGPFRKGELGAGEFEKAVFAMKPGAVSDPIADTRGVHVVRKASADPIALALVHVNYGMPTSVGPGSAALAEASGTWQGFWPFTDFVSNMDRDFEELLSARGYHINGPFRTYDEMTFPQKKETDLLLSVSIVLHVNPLEVRRQKTSSTLKEALLGKQTFMLSGSIAIDGTMNLQLLEPLSGQKMWIKNLELPKQIIKWSGNKTYEAPADDADPQVEDRYFWQDVGLANPLAKTLEGYYQTTMQSAWNYLDPEEVMTVKKQAEEIKAKKVY